MVAGLDWLDLHSPDLRGNAVSFCRCVFCVKIDLAEFRICRLNRYGIHMGKNLLHPFFRRKNILFLLVDCIRIYLFAVLEHLLEILIYFGCRCLCDHHCLDLLLVARADECLSTEEMLDA